jgi:hypothetical protein
MDGGLKRRRQTRRRTYSEPDDPYNDYPSRLLIEPSNLTVYEEDVDEIDTGLLDVHGEPIYRHVREPMGFLWSVLEDQG